MSLENVQYRSVIRFLYLKKKSREEIQKELDDIYGEQSPSWATTKRWYNEFAAGRTSVVDVEKSGRPCEISERITEKLHEMIQNERRITTRELTVRLNVSKGTLQSLLASSGIRKLCSRFVPRLLTADMQAHRLKCCQQNLETLQRVGDHMLDNIITMDETPLSLYIPESRRESKEWKLAGETSSRKMKISSHKKALMLSIFWDANGVILTDFAESRVHLNSEYYINLVRQARKLRRKSRVSNLYYLHDNAPIHTSGLSTTAIKDCGLILLPHPPYSPDLAPSDFFLFNYLKRELRGKHFSSKEDLQKTVTDYLDEKSPDFFKNAFSQLVTRWKKCVDVSGNFFEK
ncbi:transposase [Sphingomonas sp. IW22]|uniref:transposase n=1 Tax=Sphingomonas sp. IW22 TaxID=3242489 RepID=UPI00352178B3